MEFGELFKRRIRSLLNFLIEVFIDLDQRPVPDFELSCLFVGRDNLVGEVLGLNRIEAVAEVAW